MSRCRPALAQLRIEPVPSGLHQRRPAQRADGDEGLAGGRVQPHRLHQTEEQEAQSEAAAHVRQVVFSQQHPGHAHQEGPQVEQDPQGHLRGATVSLSRGHCWQPISQKNKGGLPRAVLGAMTVTAQWLPLVVNQNLQQAFKNVNGSLEIS